MRIDNNFSKLTAKSPPCSIRRWRVFDYQLYLWLHASRTKALLEIHWCSAKSSQRWLVLAYKTHFKMTPNDNISHKCFFPAYVQELEKDPLHFQYASKCDPNRKNPPFLPSEDDRSAAETELYLAMWDFEQREHDLSHLLLERHRCRGNCPYMPMVA